MCESAVQSVLNGMPIAAIPNFRAYDIRHVSKDGTGSSAEVHHVIKNRARFKRSAPGPDDSVEVIVGSPGAEETVEGSNVTQVEREAADDEAGLDLNLGLALPGANRRSSRCGC